MVSSELKVEPNLPNIFRYTSILLYPKYHPIWFLLYLYIKYQQIKKRHHKYKAVIASDIVLLNKIKSNPKYCYDVNNCILVHPDNVYFSDRLLILIANKKRRTVIVVREEFCQKDSLIISRTLYHNTNIVGDVKLIKQKPPQFASEIDVSLVSCPMDINNASIDLLIKNYFTHPKLLSAKDLITINIKQFSQSNFYLDAKLNQLENVYFLCNKLISNHKECAGQYFCCIGQTSIKQSANVQRFIPKKLLRDTRKTLDGLNHYSYVNMGPCGLSDYQAKLSGAVQPFIHSAGLKLKPVFLIQGEEGCGQEILLESVAASHGMHHFKVSNSELVANVYAQNESKLNNIFFTAKMSAPCIVSIHKFENFGKNSEGQYDQRLINSFIQSLDNLFENNTYPVILFCCTSSKDIPADLKRVFLEIFEIDAPSDNDRYKILYWLMEEAELGKEGYYLTSIANKTHGFYFEDLKALVYYAEKNFYQRSTYKKDAVLEEQDFDKALDYMQSNYNESLGAPKVPKVQWSDVGGLSDVKDEIIKTINLPLKHPELFESSGLSRSGILLFGPPGTGKTLLAKAVATECSLCFLTVKGPELLNMYVGQSEQNVREVFEKARQASPCIIFFDELDSLAPNRGISGDSGGVMDRVVSQLLAEMDGIDSSRKVFIIGATNRPDLIDPALLRPGRFDKLLFVGPCTDDDSKVSVLEALTRKFKKSKNINFQDIVANCPKNITGADFYGLCSNAWSSAAKRLITKIEKGYARVEDTTFQDVIVDMQDFKNALENVKPSISEEDLKYFENLRKELSSNA